MSAELASLRKRNDELAQQLADATQSLEALARGEVDAVVLKASSTPILLEEAQTALRRSEALMRAIFGGLLDGKLLLDDCGCVDANQAACELFSLSREQLLGRSLAELAPPDYDADAELGTAALRARGRIRGRLPILRADGTRRVLEYSAVADVVPGLHLFALRDITDRIAAEDDLRRSEARFRAILEESAEIISLTTADGTTRHLTDSAWRLVGWTADEIGGRTLRDQVLAEDQSLLDSALKRILRDGERTVTMEFRVHHRDGSIRWIESAGTNLLDDPVVAAVVFINRDVTARKRAEDELRMSRDMLEQAQSIAHVGSWSSGIGMDDEIQWTRECCRIFDVPEGTTVTVGSLLTRVHPADRGALLEANRNAVESDRPIDIEHRIERPDRRPCWVRARASVTRADGQPPRMVGTVQDVTDRVMAVEALRVSEAEFRLLAEAMPQIVWITRPDGGTVYFNRRWTEYTGLTLDESLENGWAGSLHPADREAVQRAWLSATANLGTNAVECRLLRMDGVYRWWLIRGVPVRDESGNILKWFGTCTDIDELKQGEARLRVLYDVAELLRTGHEPAQLLTAALGVLSRHLNVSRGLYAMVEADGEQCEVPADYTDGCASMMGRHRLSDFGAQLAADLRHGGAPIVVRNVDSELPREGSDALRAADIKAFVCCSLVTQGTLRALVAVTQTAARDWTPSEISIVQEVVERCWAIIEKNATDSKMRESEALLRLAGQAARVGGWSLTIPDMRLTWSEEVCAIHEVPPGTVPNLEHAIEWYAPEFRDVIREKVEACVLDGTPFDVELQIITANKRRVWVRSIGNAERSAAGAITSMRGAFQDIDDRRKLQEQLRQAQKMEAVGRLAGGVAHDFNNLLSVDPQLHGARARRAARRADPLRADLEEIQQAGERAAELTRQLLAFSRQQVLEPRVIELNEIVARHGEHARRLLGEDVELTVLSGQSARRVLADPGQIEQVVMNLAVNARDAMPDGGKLTIETANVDLDEAYARRHAGVPPGAVRDARRQRHRHRAWTRRRTRASSSRSSPPRSRARAPGSGSRPCSASCSRAAATSASTASPATARRSRSTCRAPTASPWRRSPIPSPKRSTAPRPSCSSRTRSRSAPWPAPSCAATATTCSRPRTAARRSSSSNELPARHRPAAHRRGHAAHERAASWPSSSRSCGRR